MSVAPDHEPPLLPDGAAVLRRVAAALAAAALTLGVLTTAAASGLPNLLPGAGALPAAAQGGPAAGAAPGGGISIGRVGAGTAANPVTLEQVFTLLERAESEARTSGRALSPAIDQAAAELGMVLTSYLAVHPDAAATPAATANAHLTSAGVGLGRGTGTVAATPPTGSVPPAAEPSATPSPGAETVAPSAAPSPGALTPAPGPSATPPSVTPDATTGPGTPQTVPPFVDVPPAVGPAPDEQTDVTFDDVVVAAMRLAELLDPALAYTVSVGTDLGTAGGATPLTQSLRAVVAQFGDSTAGYDNGRIPVDVLCALPFAPGHRLRCDAAAQLIALNAEYEKQFHTPIAITDSYRTLDAQVHLKQVKPYLAAVPGFSNHGWGLAVDLAAPVNSGLSPEYTWLRLHGPDYGWDNPSWARLDGSKPEPWHFEFFAAGPVPNRALSAAQVAASRAAAQHHATTADNASPTTSRPATTPAKPPADPAGTPSAGPTPKPSGTPTPTPSGTPTPTPSGTPTPKPSGTPTPTPSGTPTPTPTPTPSGTPTPTPSTSPTTPPAEPDTVTVPDIGALDLAGHADAADRVRQVLRDAGLVPDVVLQPSDEAVGTLLRPSDPAPGQEVPVGTTVTVVLSQGPATPEPTPSDPPSTEPSTEPSTSPTPEPSPSTTDSGPGPDPSPTEQASENP